MTLENRLNWIDLTTANGAVITSGFGKGVEPANLRLFRAGGTYVSMGGRLGEIDAGFPGAR